jgi:hypothetical protein
VGKRVASLFLFGASEPLRILDVSLQVGITEPKQMTRLDIPMPQELREAIVRAAHACDRSAASYVRTVVREAIKRDLAPASESKQS